VAAAPPPLLEAGRVPASSAEVKTVKTSPPAPRTGHLRVRVLTDRGAVFGGVARVEVRDASGERLSALELGPSNPCAELDCAPGEYVLALDPVGSPPLGAFPERLVLTQGTTASVDFRLTALRCLGGRLMDERELGHADVRVALERDERVVAEVRTRADGSFVFLPLPEGDYALVVGDPLGPLLPRRILRLDGELGDQVLLVPVLLELDVRVLDEQGLAVPGAFVEGVGAKGGRVAGVTDADGSLRAGLLPPGDYRLFARHPSLGRGNSIIALPAERPTVLEIRLLTGPPRR